MSLYQFPKTAAFGRMVPKNKIYERVGANAKLKALFVQNIEKITWAYKLSPQTINIPASQSVQELQVFSLSLKGPTLLNETLQAMDKVIPSPILYELNYNGRSRYTAAYKRTSEADKTKWVVSGYFETEWFNDTEERKELPVVLNMAALYQAVIKTIIPLPARQDETLEQLVIRAEQLHSKERQAKQIATQIKNQLQFNRRVELNHELNTVKQSIVALKQ